MIDFQILTKASILSSCAETEKIKVKRSLADHFNRSDTKKIDYKMELKLGHAMILDMLF